MRQNIVPVAGRNPNAQRGLAKPFGHVTICSLSVQATFVLSEYGEGRSDRGYGYGS
jgi:hypothetical protein